jgi:protein gp37
MRQAHRFSGKGGPYHGLTKLRKKGGPVWTGKVRLVEDMLDAPLHWRSPRTVFVNSMGDLFHEKLTNEEIAAVFGVMAACPQHTFQILTKRARRMREWFEWHKKTSEPLERWRLCESEAMERLGDISAVGCEMGWPLDNVWLGVSAENQEYANERLPELVKTPARVRFVSYEPALGPVDLSIWMYHGVIQARPGDDDYDAIDWVIVGGESGPGARAFDTEWARSVIAQCKKADKACFVKQLGRHPNIVPFLKSRKGGDASEWPMDLRVRAYPQVPA